MEVEHKVYWAIKSFNFDFISVGSKRKYELNELEELRLEAYDCQTYYKARTKLYQEKYILECSIKIGQHVILFFFWIKINVWKTWFRWTYPYTIIQVINKRVVEHEKSSTRENFVVNGQQIKHYYKKTIPLEEKLLLSEPMIVY